MKRFTLSFFVLLCLSLGAVALSSCAPAANNPAARTTETAAEKPVYTVKFVIRDKEYTVKVAEGETPVCPVTPPATTPAPTVGRYPFLGWDKPIRPANGDATYTAWYASGVSASLTSAKNGAKAILTMTYDDGDLATAKWVNQKNKEYKLAGSCMIITSRSGFKDHISEWRAVFADGTLEPQCHSTTHSGDTKEGPPSLYQQEIVDSKNLLATTFPKNDIICYATPYCFVTEYSYKTDANGNVIYQNGNPVKVQDGGSQKVIEENYFVNRNGPKGLQSLDPTFVGTEKGSWYNVYVQWFYTNGSQTDAERTGWIDDAVQNKGWLIILAHQITDNPDPNNDKDLYKISKSAAETFYRHAAPYVKSGELWAASFGDATKYIRERQNTTVSERFENGAVLVDMKINRTTEDNKYLTESVFDYPLTVEIRVPDSWTSARYNVDGKMQTAAVYTRDGASYAMVNLIPGADGATVTTEIYALGTK